MSNLQIEFDKLLDEQRALRAVFREKAQELFKGVTKEFFDKNPGINVIRWTQYTPFFNDGDTCEFSVNEPYYSNAKGEQIEDLTRYGEYDGEDEDVWAEENWILTGDSQYCIDRRKNIDLTGVDTESISAFSKMIQSNELEEILKAMFDDHVSVTATRDGFDVEEYEHD